MSDNKQMWTTCNVTPHRSPYLITVTRAFINDDDTFINLDSTCESGLTAAHGYLTNSY